MLSKLCNIHTALTLYIKYEFNQIHSVYKIVGHTIVHARLPALYPLHSGFSLVWGCPHTEHCQLLLFQFVLNISSPRCELFLFVLFR